MVERKGRWHKALCVMLLTSLNAGELFAEGTEDNFVIAAASHDEKFKDNDGYTINFNNVAVTEYIRFVSKIFNVNFVYEEGDLQFNITVVSEDPVSPKNVMSALVQILRVHGLNILEQENNLLITKSTDVNQIATIVSSDLPHSSGAGVPIVTRVFRIRNANLSSLVAIFRPMMSKAAIIEASLETRQLVVTDVTTNVEKIAALLKSLDAPHSPLEIEQYTGRYVPLGQLVSLTNQIVSPFAESNPLLLVPQADTNSIYIVSTPFLVEKALAVLHDLDIPAENVMHLASPENIFVYKVQHKDPSDIKRALKQIADTLSDQKNPPYKLINVLTHAKIIQSSHSLLFIADGDSLNKVKEILINVDSPLSQIGTANYFIYNIKNAQAEQIERALNQTADNLKRTENPDHDLIEAIKTLKWIKETNSLVFTGDEKSLQKIQELMALFDIPPSNTATGLAPTEFLIYSPKVRSGPEIEQSFKEITKNLKETGFADQALMQTFSTIKWVPSTNSLIFTGTKKSLEDVQTMLNTVDSGEARSESGFYLYKLQQAQGDAIIKQLEKVADDLAKSKQANSNNLVETIRAIRWVKETNSLILSGPMNEVEYVKQIISQMDTGGAGNPILRAPSTFVIYKPQYQSGPDLISILQDFKQNLIQSGVSDSGLFDTIDHLKWIDRTQSLLVSGDPNSISKIQDLLQKFDVPGTEIGTSAVGSLESTNFLIYKLQYHQGGEITAALKQIATDLANAGPAANQVLLNAVNSLQWINITNSLLASGNQETLTKLRTLIENLDVPLRQVFIEVLVIETTMSNAQNFGLQWAGKGQYLNKVAGGFSNTPILESGNLNNLMPALSQVSNSRLLNAAADIPVLPGFDLGVIGDIILHKGRSFISLGSLINALQTDSDTTVVMNPKIITQDNHNSTIFVGSNIPFSSSIVQQQNPGTVTTVNVEYRDVGVNLSITPILGNGDVITLNISNDISAQTSNQLVLSGVNNAAVTGLQTTHTNMNTRVHVPDKHFLVLSGMINDSNHHFKSQIPCLGGLPLIGAAFANNNRNRTKHNVIIFVRPQIVNTFDEYSKITDHQENLYEESAFLPAVQESFEAGIDLVKTPENE